MKITGVGIAGSMESGDILIEIEQGDEKGIQIELNSTVGNQFGKQINEVITETLSECGVRRCKVRAVDKGALDCTIRARVLAAVYRGSGEGACQWK